MSLVGEFWRTLAKTNKSEVLDWAVVSRHFWCICPHPMLNGWPERFLAVECAG